ncbi:phosphatidylserine decarboxylase [Azotosporobacter soli]|uniref:phosphatidylserine decarboxylase n=1 Tax=Azotosporobacter soli TaxID=3055040 RepID=UPI0031FE8781
MFEKRWIILARLLIALAVLNGAFFSGSSTVAAAELSRQHAPDTEMLMTIVEHNADVKRMLLQSIDQAKQINPDRETNPAQSLEEYYAYIDWATTAMPFNILPAAERYPKLYESIDQSLDYFYFINDQPLAELSGKGYYHNSLQYVEPYRSWLVVFTKHWGDYLSTKNSWNEEFYRKSCADERFGMNNGWYESPEKWTTFNEFFARYLSSPAARPIAAAANEAVVVSPADSAPQGVWKIDKDSRFVQQPGVQLKSANFNSVIDLIGKDSAYAGKFANGVLTHTFLDVNDYHRYHFPVSGTIKEVRAILADDAVGGIIVWDKQLRKYVLEDQIPGWQAIETRACVIIETEKYGLVAVLPIGMSQVSSVNFETSVKVGAKVKKGDPLGYFLFGGSDIVMLFQPQANFTLTAPALDANSYKHIYMGEAYGLLQKGVR